MAQRVSIYDTTLRDGSQGEGVSFSVADKIHITQALDSLGIQFVEGGWPGSNPKDVEYFQRVRKLKFKNIRLTAFGSTRHAKNTPGKDPNLKMLVQSEAPVITIFGKTWDLHVKDALRVSLDTNLDMIQSSVAYLAKRAESVFYDAEHFFDGFCANREYALKTLQAAVDGGAEILCLCDTNGGMLPHDVRRIVAEVAALFPDTALGIHTHNDGGMAVANTIEAIHAGARHVQGTMNGFGERTGNADLTQVVANIELKMKMRTIGKRNLRRLTEISRYVYELANLTPVNSQPYVGKSAFAHKGGIHVSAVARNKKTYEHVEPESIGNERRILISELSGRSNIAARVKVDLSDHPEHMKSVLDQIMQLENEGYAFEAAEGSFDLLVSKTTGRYTPRFDLSSWRVISEERSEEYRVSEATVRIVVGDDLHHMVAEGDHGPVDALYKATRKALLIPFPAVDALRLTDYKVHIVNAQAAAEARVRVVIQWSYQDREWGTVGVSENIIEASCQAILDSFEYLLMKQSSSHWGQKQKRSKASS